MDVAAFLKEKSDDFKLELLAGRAGLGRIVTVPSINRPGLALSGFFEHFPYERIQVMGLTELAYLKYLDCDAQTSALTKIFSDERSVSCILTRNLEPTDTMIKVFSDLDIPLLRTELISSSFISDLSYYLDDKFAPSTKIHGVMTSVYGLGVLIIGKSAIGKSECALELVKRGHKLVADDIVNIKKRLGRTLVGSGLEVTKHLIEVRGIGIIDIKELFGIGSALDEARIELVIKLEKWDNAKNHERLGIDEYYTEYLSLKVPEVTIPIEQGMNFAVLVEAASLNQRLKNKGYFTAKDLDRKQREELK